MDGQGQDQGHAKQASPSAERQAPCSGQRGLREMRADVSMCRKSMEQLRGMLDDLEFAATGAHHSWSRRDGPDEAAYQAWKRTVDDMWLSHATLDEHHALIETRARLELALARAAPLPPPAPPHGRLGRGH